APATGLSGQPLTIDWSVVNQGIGTTSTDRWTDNISLASDALGQHIVTNLGNFTHTGALAPGGMYARSGTVGLPNAISGTFYIVVHTSGPFEFLYGNNNTAVSGPVTVSQSPTPNLRVTNIETTPGTVASGSTIEVTWTVTNVGTGDADATWQDLLG